jgi:cytochrome c553
MRKKAFVWSGGLLLLVAVVAGALYGPELYALVKLGKQVDQIAQEESRTNGPWPRTSDSCAGCHGLNGNAQTQVYPHLAGQPEAYLKKQLVGFTAGERSDPTMTPLALSMSQQELEGLAAYFAKMSPLPNTTFHADLVKVARGEALAKANNCAVCHGQQLQGKDLYPRLAGQGYDYVRDQLTRFKSGARRDGSGAMPAMVAALSAQDIDDLAQFVASR